MMSVVVVIMAVIVMYVRFHEIMFVESHFVMAMVVVRRDCSSVFTKRHEPVPQCGQKRLYHVGKEDFVENVENGKKRNDLDMLERPTETHRRLEILEPFRFGQ